MRQIFVNFFQFNQVLTS